MRWEGREKSQNVEDRRGARPVGLALGGGGLLTIVIALVALFLGADPRTRPTRSATTRCRNCLKDLSFRNGSRTARRPNVFAGSNRGCSLAI